MNTFRRKAPIALVAFAALTLGATLLVWMPKAFPQSEMTSLRSEALAPHKRLAVRFVHDAHNEKAGLEDCAVCHHDAVKDGKMTMESSSEGIPCADCHAADAQKGTPLQRAFHRQCIECHQKGNKGPTACGGCHAV